MTMLGRVAERKGEAGKWVLITELKEIADQEEVLDRGEIGRIWGIGVDLS